MKTVTYLFKVVKPNKSCLVNCSEVVCELVLNKLFWVLETWCSWRTEQLKRVGLARYCFISRDAFLLYVALWSVDSSGVTWQLPGIGPSSNWKNLGRVKLFWKAESCWKVIRSVTENELEYIELEPWKGFLWNWGTCRKRITLNVKCAGVELSSRNWRLSLACWRLCLH